MNSFIYSGKVSSYHFVVFLFRGELMQKKQSMTCRYHGCLNLYYSKFCDVHIKYEILKRSIKQIIEYTLFCQVKIMLDNCKEKLCKNKLLSLYPLTCKNIFCKCGSILKKRIQYRAISCSCILKLKNGVNTCNLKKYMNYKYGK